jgi:pyruvate carboxylase subunit B
MLGYPPLVTPFSQYTKNIALMNVMSLVKGGKRFAMIDNNSWDMILGKAGKLPGPLAPEIIELAKAKGLQFYDGLPQDNYPNELDKYRKEMADNNWDCGQNDEELFELAMHDRQYRDYKSGVAKKRFEEELKAAKEAANAPVVQEKKVINEIADIKWETKYPNAKPVISPVKGQLLWEADFQQNSIPIPIGTTVKEGESVCYVVTYYGTEEVISNFDGKVVAVLSNQGKTVNKGEVLLLVE